MQKITLLFGIFLGVFFISCEGPTGPPGYDGKDGEKGKNGEDGIIGQVFEIENVDFMYEAGDNMYSYLITLSDFTNFEVLPADAILVYKYDGTIDYQDNTSADAWSLIPQNFFVPQGTIQYTNAHTDRDVEIFIDGNFNLSNLDTAFINDQIFRIVILPSNFTSAKMDKSNMSNVMSTLGVTEKDVQRFTLN